MTAPPADRPAAGSEDADGHHGPEHLYLRRLGERLRVVRRRSGLSLKTVEARSGGEFKASALGAYERAQRTISVARLHRLATLYRVSVDELLAEDDAVTEAGDARIIDLRELEGRSDHDALAALKEAVERLLRK